MKTFRILYQWQGRHYQTTMEHYSASSAFFAATVMIQPGAVAYGIVPVAL